MPANNKENKIQQTGDTSRTSSQGRKLASGGNIRKRGDKEIDENTKNRVSDTSQVEEVKHRKAR